MMDPLLRHVVDITSHRDHALLDVSVVAGLSSVLGLSSVRLLEISTACGTFFLTQKAWIQAGAVVSANETAGMEGTQESIESYAELMACLQNKKNFAESVSPDGKEHFLWFPVWAHDKPLACIEISSNTPFSDKAHSIIEGILQVYRNFQSLLDYSERDSLTGPLNRKTFDEKFAKMAVSTFKEETATQKKDGPAKPKTNS